MVRSYETVQPVPFGSYQLVERLAMGGMAEVYLARPDGQERFVALKRILPNIAADDEFIAMFIDEAKIAGQLNHPNVAQIFDLGKINNSYFIAMEYVSGHDLRALWDKTRDADGGKTALPIGLACYVVKKICDGLDYAHRRRDSKGRPLGIIHRDVSPQNILVSYDGDLKIIDFGIAKAANRIVKTQTGILKGKFAYMAPEQARGEPTDHRADIFAIGVILYEMLTGERCFKAESDFALLEKVRRVDMPSPRSLRPEIPKDLERIVYKALAKEAGDRYAWASALGSDLDRFMSDQGWASSKEELGAFLQRTFKEEFKEEERRLVGYRSLFEKESAQASSVNTVMHEGRPDISSVPPTSIGDAEHESDMATSFGDGGPTAATDLGGDKSGKAGAAGRNGKGGKRKNGVGESTAQLLELRDAAQALLQGPGQARPGGGNGANLASQEIDDDEIDASAEASAVGTAVDAVGPNIASRSTQSAAVPAGDPETSPRNGTARRSPRSRVIDETQIDPDAPMEPEARPPPPVPVARDEMPKKLRVVSGVTARPEPPASDERSASGARVITDRVDRVERVERVERPERADRFERLERPEPLRERSSLSRGRPPAPPPRSSVAPVLIAAALGAIIGGGVIGIAWLAAAPSSTTVVFVATPRQTEVRLGKQVLCAQTPCAVLLEPGKHEIRFKAPGAEELSRTVDVKADGTPPVEVTLERTRGDIRLETKPPGATVYLDDRQVGTTPLTLPRLTMGNVVRLKLVREGFEPLEVSRAVDDAQSWRYELPTSTTTWTLTSDPDDALFEGPGREVGDKLLVTVGSKRSAQVRVVRPGCTDRTVTLVATGKPEAAQKVLLDCKRLDAGLEIRAPRGTRIKIDNTELSRHAHLERYRLPAGTFNVQLRSPRGRTEVQTVELHAKETLILKSKLR